jgi:hypothetical protein
MEEARVITAKNFCEGYVVPIFFNHEMTRKEKNPQGDASFLLAPTFR